MSQVDPVKALVTDPVMQQRLAKYIALKCFRNSVLEDYHAGTVPDSQTGDYADVSVHTPFGEIPWANLSRISDSEMKTLMLDVTNRLYQLVQELFDENRSTSLLLELAAKDPAPTWQNPK